MCPEPDRRIDPMRAASSPLLVATTNDGKLREIRPILSDLPIEYREPLVLCDLEDMAAREAAEILKISVPALKSRLYRGRRALRDKLGGTLERTS